MASVPKNDLDWEILLIYRVDASSQAIYTDIDVLVMSSLAEIRKQDRIRVRQLSQYGCSLSDTERRMAGCNRNLQFPC
jgi:hypothetical protein